MEDPAKFDTWLASTARRLSISEARKEMSRANTVGVQEVAPSPAEEIEEADTLRFQAMCLRSEISRLPDAERELMQWKLNGMGLKEMAEKKGISTTAVGVKIRRAKNRLRERLANRLEGNV